MNETSVKQGNFENVSSIEVELPTSNWQLNDIELNFTDILELGKEIVNIEDKNYTGIYNDIYYKNKNFRRQGLGVQIKLNKTETLYGVYIYGKKVSDTYPKIIQVQIRGYDSISNSPNNSYYLTMDINMSTQEGWYLQNFTSPLTLPDGNFYLVLNGTNLSATGDDSYYWYYNDIDPTNSNLSTSEYDDTDTWSNGTSNSPYLYKIIRMNETLVYPEEINMTAEFNSYSYQVLNGYTQGEGYLKRNNINYKPHNEQIEIQIENNKTETLKFSLNYNFNISNIFNAPGELNVTTNRVNQWNINPEITRVSNNHTVQFEYPKSWFNLKIFKNQEEITSEIIINTIDHSIIIPNNIIENGVNWEITANSPHIDITINAPKTDFKIEQELRFSVNSPILAGNYTFILNDPFGLEKYQLLKQLPSESNLFSYEIPANSIEGDYIAYLFWNNETDAGSSLQIFTITKATLTNSDKNLFFFLIIGLIIGGGITLGFSSYVAIKKVGSKRREKLNLILKQCNDIMNIKNIIVLDVKTGIDLFSQSFEKNDLDPTLISGFLQAIHNFGVEVIEGAKNSKTVKVEYKDSIIFMTEFINLRLIVIMKSNPSKNFIYSIESLAYHIYKYYGKLIDDFQGNLIPFRSIKKLVESDLNVSLLYPLTVTIKKDMKLNQDERDMVKKAQTFMKEHNFPYFYFLYLIPENTCSPKDYQITLQLIKKGIFQPIDKKEYSN
ncbi:MAG: hypothetical protein ACFFA8_06060 [Promethearchaeota archaeon]